MHRLQRRKSDRTKGLCTRWSHNLHGYFQAPARLQRPCSLQWWAPLEGVLRTSSAAVGGCLQHARQVHTVRVQG